ncbi:DNA cytosine methyltransferase [Brevibacterium sp. CSND-B09]|uniref:DNA cytosine methyltransferase n=1 Tax=Brevibacterium sp. CSND-B09 TaxID=3462571 RepID=UPI00406A95FD
MPKVTSIDSIRPQVLEFFAGIGLARIGLESAGFKVSWANDFAPDKKSMYESQFVDDVSGYVSQDIATIEAAQLPRGASLAWASSPCTDLSLAGTRSGLRGTQSGTFWHLIRILEDLGEDRPSLVVLENVTGLATSHGGDDISAAIRAFNSLGYSVDVLSIDARRFVPQSRPRLFLVGAQVPPQHSEEVSTLRPDWLQWIFDDPTLVTHKALLPEPPELLAEGLENVIELVPAADERWWGAERTSAFVDSLSSVQLERLNAFLNDPTIRYRTAYRRTRKGNAVWEMRPDDIAGCLRTARGGSSKQAVVQVGGGRVRVRWMTPLEYARLMGAGDYNLGGLRASQILFGFGDAVAVPVVRWLGEHYLRPLIRGTLGVQDVAHSLAVGDQLISHGADNGK